MSKISFLVTYYNQAQYVTQSLESILAIDFTDGCLYEILVGDDGSSDGTQAAVQKYMEKYPGKIKLFEMPREQNVKYNSILRASANRLNLLSNAAGDYYCILDGDDWYCDKTFISDAIEVMEKNRKISVCAFNFQYAEPNGIKINECLLKCGLLSAKTYLRNIYLHAGACVFKNVFDKKKIEFMRKTGYFDDQNITIANLNCGEMYFIPKVIYSYRQTGESVWTGISEYERNVINALDYDVNLRYAPKYSKEIKQKSFGALDYVWQNRNNFYSDLGNDKADKYLSMAKSLENSMFAAIINFDTLDVSAQKNIENFFKPRFLSRMKRAIKYFLHLDK
ncbi:MAG: glycosyltransferase family 2 protein [Treponema sp.]